MSDNMGIRGYDYVEFYVGSAKATAEFFAKALGMHITAYSGPEMNVRDRMSFYLPKDNLRILVTSPLEPSWWELYDVIARLGAGV